VGTAIVIVVFGAAYVASLFADRVLRRHMSNFARGIFTLVVGYAFLLGLMMIPMST
jgi:predicted transporter